MQKVLRSVSSGSDCPALDTNVHQLHVNVGSDDLQLIYADRGNAGLHLGLFCIRETAAPAIEVSDMLPLDGRC